jgi:ferredoxin
MGNRVWKVGSLIPGRIMQTPGKSSRELSNPKNIVLEQHGKNFEIRQVKGKLLDIALNQGNALSYNCRKGTCGECTVKIIGNENVLSEPNEKEKEKLREEIHNGFRLACQAEVL